eukprot:TRINITY_DN65050_c0_g1_i1.p1 TRINITY_DN65050_c0_g1~~TRINITY_DN65050_c0_g1_i1.p1  ORF type:complete len:660 (-),score=180.07 TRINITY_DN65050_c0_g1_i1:71-2050(-)
MAPAFTVSVAATIAAAWLSSVGLCQDADSSTPAWVQNGDMSQATSAASSAPDDDKGGFPDAKFDDPNKHATSDFAFGLLDPVNEKDVQKSVDSFMSRSADAHHRARLARLVGAMRPLYSALPKDKSGRLAHQTARYAVHRFMMSARGWFVRGLEASAEGVKHQKGHQTEWVPTYVQQLLENRSGKPGASLSDLAGMTAVMEDLIHGEISTHLKAIYKYLGLPTKDPIGKDKFICVADAFMMYSMTYDLVQQTANVDPFNLTGSLSFEQRQEKLCTGQLLRKLSGYRTSLDEWKLKAINSVGAGSGSPVSFAQAAGFAHKFASEYHKHNEVDCKGLKQTMVDLEGRDGATKPGRVALSSYYKQKHYAFWQFVETKENLKSAGVIDDTEAVAALVVPNYVGSRVNCVESSTLYALCCKIECDDILAQLENHFKAPAATASQIVKMVSKLPSSNVQTPREISPELLNRLNQLEKAHKGRVPIHSEAFAIWLHHAYPRDCPLPHPERSARHPMTAGEWLHEVGHDWAEESKEQAASGMASEGGLGGFTKCILLVVSIVAGVCWGVLRKEERRGIEIKEFLYDLLGAKLAQKARPWFGALALLNASVVLFEGIPVTLVLVICGTTFAVKMFLDKKLGNAFDGGKGGKSVLPTYACEKKDLGKLL